MKRLFLLLVSAMLVLGFSGQSMALPLLYDNFDAEHGGTGALNYAAFSNWTVSEGTVDLIGNGFYDFLPGNGLYVDLDGSTSDAGIMTSKASFTFESGALYEFSFSLAGSNTTRTASETVAIQVALGNLVSDTITLLYNDPFNLFKYSFYGDGTSGTLGFAKVERVIV